MHESADTEFKSDLSNSFLKTVSAYANYRNGTIIFGISDDGQSIGLEGNIDAVATQIEQKINDSIQPVPRFELRIDYHARTIHLNVFRGEDTPYLYNGKAYRRSHTSTRPVDQAELRQLSLDGLHIAYDDLPSGEKNLEFTKLASAFRDQAAIEDLDADTLRTLGLLRADGQYTNAAVLLADSNRYTGIQWQRSNGSANQLRGHGDLSHTSILQQLDDLTGIFENYYTAETIDKPSGRTKTWDVPPDAFREAVANAIVHRAWNIDAPTTVGMYPDRIEIVSPGGLPSGLSEDEYLNKQISIPRNPTLAYVFYRLGLIERFGTGVRRIRNAYADYVPQPTFNVSENSIAITLPTISVPSNGTTTDETAILGLLRRATELSRRDIEDKTGLSRGRVLRALSTLQESGAVIKTGSGPATTYKAI